MRFSRLRLENWKNFLSVDVSLSDRVFLVGPNAAGKSNLLDAFRFLRDIAEAQGGLLRAVESRRGFSQLRSLHARRSPNIAIEVEAELGEGAHWTYRLEVGQDKSRRPRVKREWVRLNQQVLLDRPDAQDGKDSARLTQTHLEQINSNRRFRELAEFFAGVRYLHLVPQLVRDAERSLGNGRDPFGSTFLEVLATTQKRTLDARLRRIGEALRVAVPQLKDLRLERDDRGTPHLLGRYEHWRPNAGWQSEKQFSDGTLRLIGLLWALLEGDQPLLLEEPELSLHKSVVQLLPQVFHRTRRRADRQLLISTHSADLLSDSGIGGEEILVLYPAAEGTEVRLGVEVEEIRNLLEAGCPAGEAVLPQTEPRDVDQLTLFGH